MTKPAAKPPLRAAALPTGPGAAARPATQPSRGVLPTREGSARRLDVARKPAPHHGGAEGSAPRYSDAAKGRLAHPLLLALECDRAHAQPHLRAVLVAGGG